MAKRKSTATRTTCSCGRQRDDAAAHVHHAHSGRYVYRRCECGFEWTERSGFYLSEPIASDELIEVHQQLASLHGSLGQLLGLERPAA